MIRFAFLIFYWMRRRRGVSFLLVLMLLSVAVLGNAATFYAFDNTPQNPVTFWDALWYSIISITTIGYGDYSASSFGARAGTIFFIVLLGLAIFTVFLGLVTDGLTKFIVKGQKGMAALHFKDHVLIVNFPSESRIRQIISELKSDGEHEKKEIVLVTDQVRELPFDIEGVSFVYGSPLEEEPYQRAGIDKACYALVLATSYTDPASDAVAASAVTVIESLNSDIVTVVECLHANHRRLFKATRGDALVTGMEIAGSLLVQELHDPGVSKVIEEITSNLKGTTIYSTRVGRDMPKMTYAEMAKKLIDDGINVVSVIQKGESHTSFQGLDVTPGDTLVYLGTHRRTWEELMR